MGDRTREIVRKYGEDTGVLQNQCQDLRSRVEQGKRVADAPVSEAPAQLDALRTQLTYTD